MSFLGKLADKHAFRPGFISLLTNPFYISRKDLYLNIKMLAPHVKGKILDVGCGRKPYKELFSFEKYIGIDIENPGHSHENEDIDIYYDGKKFPLDDETFDSILCNQVTEHVFEPDQLLAEIYRVLKPGGVLLLTVPFVWDEHEQPNDYARYSSFGIKYLIEKNGFELTRAVKSVNTIAVLFQLMNAYIFKKLMSKSKILYYLSLPVFIFPSNLIGSALGFLLPSNNDLYLDNIVLAKKSNKQTK